MKKLFLVLFLSLFSSLFAMENEEHIKKLIGRTIILGFNGSTLSNQLKNDIDKYNLGGVILFNKDYETKKPKNIINPTQLKKLTKDIQNYSSYKMFISIDQEGGLVSRLNQKNGFSKIESAKSISTKGESFAKENYSLLVKQLNQMNINLDFAPVVDLSINSQNKVIVKYERSYSKKPEEVVKYAKIFIDELHKKDIYSVLKHFPGHGSSKDDSHKGFVDITNTWQEIELEPYKKLIKEKKVKFIMTAHVFNKNLDKNHPVTLSYNINTKLLREKLKYKNLIISDDMQMKAITNHYTLKEAVTLAINSGVNILLFGNQLSNNSLEEIVNTIYEQVKLNKISYKKLLESYKKISELK